MYGLSSAKASLRKFHNDEDGMEIIESVMILAIAAALGIALYYFFTKTTEGGIFKAFSDMVTGVFDAVTKCVTGFLKVS
jgi:Flp pilus assembly pilin Flp